MQYKGIAFFDMDGVLADCSHRLKYLSVNDKKSFYSYDEVVKDPVIEAGKALEKGFFAAGYKIIIVSSRRESCLDSTFDWLQNNGFSEVEKKNIYLKRTGDERESWDVKIDLLGEALDNNAELYGKSDANFFIDDHPKNCQRIEDNFAHDIQPLVFGLGRINDETGEY